MTLSYNNMHLYTRYLRAFFRKVKKTVLKRLPRESILRFFRYRHALLQKNKNVLTICEYIFVFLKECVPITEKSQYPFPFQDFQEKCIDLYEI